MRTTYAVSWREEDGEAGEGRLELQATGLRLGEGDAVRELPYRDISEVRLDQSGKTLVLERRTGVPIHITSNAQPAVVSELAGRLAALVLAQRTTSRIVVVLPIKESAHEQVRELVSKGPPFDLETSGLDHHHVFLSANEVVFVFEAPEQSVLRRLASNLHLLAAAEAWQEYAAGPARIAEDVFSWTRGNVAEGLSFAPTPGPGDSEGGDLYSP